MKKIVVISILLSLAAASFAQGTAGRFLDMGSDARFLSVAGSSAAAEATSHAVWNNGAAVPYSEKTMSVSAGYAKWRPDLSGLSALSASGFGRIADKIGVFAGFRHARYGSYEIADQNGVYGARFTPREMDLAVGAAYRIAKKISASVSMHYVSSDLGAPKTASAVAADLGLQYRTEKFGLALTASHLGSSLDYGGTATYRLPARADISTSYTFGFGGGKHSLGLSATAGYLLFDSDFTAAAGCEFRFARLFRLAGGYAFSSGPAVPGFASVGAGVEWKGIALDFTYLSGNTLVFNIGYSF